MVKVTIQERLCKSCGLCVQVCPRGCLGMSDKINDMGYSPARYLEDKECTGCASCALMCPDLAICLEKEETAV